MTNLNYTPLLFTLSDFLYQENYVKEVTSNNIIEDIQLLEPRYYLNIFSPINNRQLDFPDNSIKIPLDNKGLLKNTIRLQLKPCVGYGINSCYKIQFWKWYPITNNSFSKIKISRELVREDYILVPAIDSRTYLANWNYLNPTDYKYPSYYRESLLKAKEIEVTRYWNNKVNVNSIEVVDVINNPFQHLDLTMLSNSNSTSSMLIDKYEYEFDREVKELRVDWIKDYEGATPNNINRLLPYGELVDNKWQPIPIKYNVSYVRPLTLKEVYFTDFIEEKYTLQNKLPYNHF